MVGALLTKGAVTVMNEFLKVGWRLRALICVAAHPLLHLLQKCDRLQNSGSQSLISFARRVILFHSLTSTGWGATIYTGSVCRNWPESG